MNLNLKNRKSEYFNSYSIYAFYDFTINKLFSSKVHFHNGKWWTDRGLKYNATTIKSCLIKEVINL